MAILNPGLRISPGWFEGVIFTLYIFVTCLAIARTVCRYVHFRALSVDDLFLWIAVTCMTAATGVLYHLYPYLYMEMSLAQGIDVGHSTESIVTTTKLGVTAAMLIWAAIFCVKFSFLFFFRRLVYRVRRVGVWWWVVFGILVPGACVCIPLSLLVCDDFSTGMASRG